MSKITINFEKAAGRIKCMHAVNNGPVDEAIAERRTGNMVSWMEAGIPFARNHDAACFATYGGEHTVDITAIFPDFDADVNDEASYDFAVTDEYTKTILKSGTKVFYRLGQKIDHRVKKYDSIPPKDFFKWAQICEHIIRHYNEGWADGFEWNIEYWEIWNEPDLGIQTWYGTKNQFFDLFETTAKHLKSCFPNLKIGGPAIAGDEAWADEFLQEMRNRRVEMDFFSWHIYMSETKDMIEKAQRVRKLLVKYGYGGVESICNEWNYVKDWVVNFNDTVETIISMKGAAFTAAGMLAAQNAPIDMLMYYDARPSVYCGLFDMYTFRLLKGYYPFKMFNQLYQMGTAVECVGDDGDIYMAAAKDEADGRAVMISYYTDDVSSAAKKTVCLDIIGGTAEYEMYLLDEKYDCERMANLSANATVVMEPNSVLLLKNASCKKAQNEA